MHNYESTTMNFNTLLEEIAIEQDKKAVVAIGRFSVPTIAHYHIFSKMKEYARKQKSLNLSPVPIVMVIEGKETSKDKSKNPLSAEDRIKFMKASGKADGVKFIIAPDAFTAFAMVRNEGFEPLVIAAGSDRLDSYLEILNKNFKTKDDKPIKHSAIPDLFRDEDGKFSKVDLKKIMSSVKEDETIEMSKVSSSLARLAVTMNELNVFSILTGLTKKPALAELLFKKVKSAMTASNEEKEKSK